MKTLEVVLMLLFAAASVDAYKPVIIVHGLFDGPKVFKTLSGYINKVHPGTEVTVINLFDNLASLKPMWKQVRGFRKLFDAVVQKAPDGVHLLCFSQGGLICRALLSTTPNHNVDTFISLSSPLAGQFGETEYYLRWLPPAKKEVYRFCYKFLGQKISICNYWNDPHQRSSYLMANDFLTLLDGDKAHREMKAWRRNFLLIKKLVLIGGPDDGVITPWQSSLFGFYDSNETVVEMRNQKFYRDDTFGLKTLDAHGDVSMCVHSGVKHCLWHSNFTVFRSCIETWLT
ncbi:lysosomal thioesterase PPT2-like [Brachyistius frenatus]|uniref:lysosomal thioesterase PPT2-like n=1 Tax=Brachyistius frenatus TaxID=100188 RepID=UPI0037E94C70